MDTTAQAPVQETSQADDQKASANQVISRLNDVHYLLNSGNFQGKDAELVTLAKDFIIGFKKHIESQARA